MALNINGTTGISGVDGSASAPALTGTDANTGINFGSDVIDLSTGGSSRFKVGAAGQLGVAGANYGTSGQALLSQGASAAPQWGSISAGIEEADVWRLGAIIQGTSSESTLSTSIDRASDNTYIGTGMSETSGIFTFGATGIYLIYVQLTAYGGYAYGRARIHTHLSVNSGSSYNAVAIAHANVSQNSGYGGGSSMAIVDIQDTSTHRVRFRQDTSSTASRYIFGDSGYNATAFTFIRLAAT
ncbi:c1q globular head like domain containing protein [uncultured Mediterranean phage uvMED]|nr:c1q globular head like domain containing protein [uncultured Mediterranean phage uvMED]